MVRNYHPGPISSEAVERIVTAALSAPSAGYSQGQSLVVITDRTTRANIASLADEPRYVAQGFDPWLSNAAVHIVLCVSAEAYQRRYREPDKMASRRSETPWPVPFWWVDAGASLMAILLAAVDEGLAGGFLGAHAVPGLAELLGVPDHTTPVGVVTIGFPAADRRSTSLNRGKRPRSEVVHYGRWSSPSWPPRN